MKLSAPLRAVLAAVKLAGGTSARLAYQPSNLLIDGKGWTLPPYVADEPVRLELISREQMNVPELEQRGIVFYSAFLRMENPGLSYLAHVENLTAPQRAAIEASLAYITPFTFDSVARGLTSSAQFALQLACWLSDCLGKPLAVAGNTAYVTVAGHALGVLNGTPVGLPDVEPISAETVQALLHGETLAPWRLLPGPLVQLRNLWLEVGTETDEFDRINDLLAVATLLYPNTILGAYSLHENWAERAARQNQMLPTLLTNMLSSLPTRAAQANNGAATRRAKLQAKVAALDQSLEAMQDPNMTDYHKAKLLKTLLAGEVRVISSALLRELWGSADIQSADINSRLQLVLSLLQLQRQTLHKRL